MLQSRVLNESLSLAARTPRSLGESVFAIRLARVGRPGGPSSAALDPLDEHSPQWSDALRLAKDLSGRLGEEGVSDPRMTAVALSLPEGLFTPGIRHRLSDILTHGARKHLTPGGYSPRGREEVVPPLPEAAQELLLSVRESFVSAIASLPLVAMHERAALVSIFDRLATQKEEVSTAEFFEVSTHLPKGNTVALCEALDVARKGVVEARRLDRADRINGASSREAIAYLRTLTEEPQWHRSVLEALERVSSDEAVSLFNTVKSHSAYLAVVEPELLFTASSVMSLAFSFTLDRITLDSLARDRSGEILSEGLVPSVVRGAASFDRLNQSLLAGIFELASFTASDDRTADGFERSHRGFVRHDLEHVNSTGDRMVSLLPAEIRALTEVCPESRALFARMLLAPVLIASYHEMRERLGALGEAEALEDGEILWWDLFHERRLAPPQYCEFFSSSEASGSSRQVSQIVTNTWKSMHQRLQEITTSSLGGAP